MAEVSEVREPLPDMQGEGYVVPLLTVEVQVQTSEYCLQNQGTVAITAFRFTHTRNVAIRINLGRFDVRWRSPTSFINELFTFQFLVAIRVFTLDQIKSKKSNFGRSH